MYFSLLVSGFLGYCQATGRHFHLIPFFLSSSNQTFSFLYIISKVIYFITPRWVSALWYAFDLLVVLFQSIVVLLCHFNHSYIATWHRYCSAYAWCCDVCCSCWETCCSFSWHLWPITSKHTHITPSKFFPLCSGSCILLYFACTKCWSALITRL